MIINNFEKDNVDSNISLMEQWSIPGNAINYAQYKRNSRDYLKLNIKELDEKNHRIMNGKLEEKDRQIIELDFHNTSEKLKGEYLDMYDGVRLDILHTMKFDVNSDLSTTYLGRIDKTMSNRMKVEEIFPISEQGYTVGKLLDGTECQILLVTGSSKSFTFKIHYLKCKSLHSLPKFASKTLRIQVGNGQYNRVLFVIPIVIDIHDNRFEIFMLVSEIHENVDVV